MIAKLPRDQKAVSAPCGASWALGRVLKRFQTKRHNAQPVLPFRVQLHIRNEEKPCNTRNAEDLRCYAKLRHLASFRTQFADAFTLGKSYVVAEYLKRCYCHNRNRELIALEIYDQFLVSGWVTYVVRIGGAKI